MKAIIKQHFQSTSALASIFLGVAAIGVQAQEAAPTSAPLVRSAPAQNQDGTNLPATDSTSGTGFSTRGGNRGSPVTRGTIGGAGGGGFGRGGVSGGMASASPRMQLGAVGEGPSSSFDATVYAIEVMPDQIGRIDAEALSKAAGNAADFEAAMAKFGKVRPLYRVNHVLRLESEGYVQIGNNVPYVTNSQVTQSGQTVNSVSYTSVGAVFDIIPKMGNGGMINIEMQVQLTTLAEGTTPLSPTVMAPIFRSTVLSRNGQVEPERPFVVITADATSLDKEGKAVAYAARMILGTPKGAANAPK